jgi:hypothetical protein
MDLPITELLYIVAKAGWEAHYISDGFSIERLSNYPEPSIFLSTFILQVLNKAIQNLKLKLSLSIAKSVSPQENPAEVSYKGNPCRNISRSI